MVDRSQRKDPGHLCVIDVPPEFPKAPPVDPPLPNSPPPVVFVFVLPKPPVLGVEPKPVPCREVSSK